VDRRPGAGGLRAVLPGHRRARGSAPPGRRRAAQALSAGTGAPILVVHASQTGFAEELAMATARLLGDAGARVTLKSLAEVTVART
jgi:sulfite reductase alpha subunit-like flavoprotein